MNVFVDITHSSISDLGILLTHLPQDQGCVLYQGNCLGQNMRTVFDDGGVPLATTGVCPPVNPYAPVRPAQGLLDRFKNRDMGGVWILTIMDGDTSAPLGTLNRWCLKFSVLPAPTPASRDELVTHLIGGIPLDFVQESMADGNRDLRLDVSDVILLTTGPATSSGPPPPAPVDKPRAAPDEATRP